MFSGHLGLRRFINPEINLQPYEQTYINGCTAIKLMHIGDRENQEKERRKRREEEGGQEEERKRRGGERELRRREERRRGGGRREIIGEGGDNEGKINLLTMTTAALYLRT